MNMPCAQGGVVAKPRCRTLRVFPIALNVLPQNVLQLENSFHRKLETLNRKIICKGNTPSPGCLSALSHGLPSQPQINLLHITRGHSKHNVPRLPQAAILQRCFGTAPQPSILPLCDHLGRFSKKNGETHGSRGASCQVCESTTGALRDDAVCCATSYKNTTSTVKTNMRKDWRLVACIGSTAKVYSTVQALPARRPAGLRPGSSKPCRGRALLFAVPLPTAK